MDRRSFLERSLFISLGAIVAPLTACSKRVGPPTELPVILKDSEWKSIAAVQDHLFPSEPDSPGARDANALPYLASVLHSPKTDPREIDFIRAGVFQLQGISKNSHGHKFDMLSFQEREQVLNELSKSELGEQWILRILNYVFEALLGAPAYGGNPDQLGWKWVNHNPGFPLPKRGKRHFELYQRT